MRQYFNPRSPMEILQYPTIFQSTLPHGERRGWTESCIVNDIISIHAPRMGSDSDNAINIRVILISIHAPRMGSDSKNMRFLLCFCNFH